MASAERPDPGLPIKLEPCGALMLSAIPFGGGALSPHLLGKLLLAFGEDNVLWGTDSIWYGSPQDQIEAFRSFRITPEFQDRFGYPDLTDEVKRKILGHNAARLFGIDPPTLACEISRDDVVGIRAELTSTHHTHPEAALATYGRSLADGR